MKKCTLLVFEQIQVGPRWSLQVVTLKTRRLFKNCSRKAESTSPNTSSIPVDLSRSIKARYLSRYLLIYQAYGIFDIAYNVLILKGFFFLWVCIILIGLGKPKVCVNLFGIGEPLSFYLKEVEKEKP